MARVKLSDRLHRYFVLTCVATTVAGVGVLGMRAYNFFLYVYPQHRERKRLEQENLLMEGKSSNTLLTDTAPTLSN